MRRWLGFLRDEYSVLCWRRPMIWWSNAAKIGLKKVSFHFFRLWLTLSFYIILTQTIVYLTPTLFSSIYDAITTQNQ